MQTVITGGNVLFLRLLHSRIEVEIPIYGQVNDSETAEVMMPDIYISKTFEEIKNGVDGQLKKLLAKLKK